MIRLPLISLLRRLAPLGLSALLASEVSGLTQFDFNAAASPTQPGWVAADLGNGSDGTISIDTIALGDVILSARDRGIDNGGGAESEMWRDFIFASGSYANNPDSGLQITISGLLPDTRYPLTLWAFDDASPPQTDTYSRAADWSDGEGEGGVLSFPDGPDPSSLDEYLLSFVAKSGIDGEIVLTGVAAAVNPSSSHNVFINGLEIGDPVFDSDGDGLSDAFEQIIIDADDDDLLETFADVLPGDDFDLDGSDNAEESDRDTDPTDADSDDDGFLDGVENGGGTWLSNAATGTDPLDPDSDADGLPDGVENPDLPYDPGNPTGQPGSDPNRADSDGDSIRDGSEITEGSDPTDPLSFFDAYADAVAKFDFNHPDPQPSPTQNAWIAADLGSGSGRGISITTEAIGTATLASRDRQANNTDTGDIDHNDLWRDFVFANGSNGFAPGSGLRLTLTGLAASTTYPVTVWGFDSSSIGGRVADWGQAGTAAAATLSFPSPPDAAETPDPASLDDYMVTFEIETDASGQAIIEGVVAAEEPHPISSNVFINALAIGQPTGGSAIRITAFDFHPEGGDSSITWTSTPGKRYALDRSTDLRGWPGDVDDGYAAAEDAVETTYVFDASGVGPRSYFRIREVPE